MALDGQIDCETTGVESGEGNVDAQSVDVDAPLAAELSSGKLVVPRGTWTAEEDDLLRGMCRKYGPRHWNLVAKGIPGRSAKSCRLRWFNQLDPTINRDPFSEEEDRAVLKAYAKHGRKWAVIAARLQGRTDNMVKNRWNTGLRRKYELILGAHKTGQCYDKDFEQYRPIADIAYGRNSDALHQRSNGNSINGTATADDEEWQEGKEWSGELEGQASGHEEQQRPRKRRQKQQSQKQQPNPDTAGHPGAYTDVGSSNADLDSLLASAIQSLLQKPSGDTVSQHTQQKQQLQLLQGLQQQQQQQQQGLQLLHGLFPQQDHQQQAPLAHSLFKQGQPQQQQGQQEQLDSLLPLLAGLASSKQHPSPSHPPVSSLPSQFSAFLTALQTPTGSSLPYTSPLTAAQPIPPARHPLTSLSQHPFLQSQQPQTDNANVLACSYAPAVPSRSENGPVADLGSVPSESTWQSILSGVLQAAGRAAAAPAADSPIPAALATQFPTSNSTSPPAPPPLPGTDLSSLLSRALALVTHDQQQPLSSQEIRPQASHFSTQPPAASLNALASLLSQAQGLSPVSGAAALPAPAAAAGSVPQAHITPSAAAAAGGGGGEVASAAACIAALLAGMGGASAEALGGELPRPIREEAPVNGSAAAAAAAVSGGGGGGGDQTAIFSTLLALLSSGQASQPSSHAPPLPVAAPVAVPPSTAADPSLSQLLAKLLGNSLLPSSTEHPLSTAISPQKQQLQHPSLSASGSASGSALPGGRPHLVHGQAPLPSAGPSCVNGDDPDSTCGSPASILLTSLLNLCAPPTTTAGAPVAKALPHVSQSPPDASPPAPANPSLDQVLRLALAALSGGKVKLGGSVGQVGENTVHREAVELRGESAFPLQEESASVQEGGAASQASRADDNQKGDRVRGSVAGGSLRSGRCWGEGQGQGSVLSLTDHTAVVDGSACHSQTGDEEEEEVYSEDEIGSQERESEDRGPGNCAVQHDPQGAEQGLGRGSPTLLLSGAGRGDEGQEEAEGAQVEVNKGESRILDGSFQLFRVQAGEKVIEENEGGGEEEGYGLSQLGWQAFLLNAEEANANAAEGGVQKGRVERGGEVDSWLGANPLEVLQSQDEEEHRQSEVHQEEDQQQRQETYVRQESNKEQQEQHAHEAGPELEIQQSEQPQQQQQQKERKEENGQQPSAEVALASLPLGEGPLHQPKSSLMGRGNFCGSRGLHILVEDKAGDAPSGPPTGLNQAPPSERTQPRPSSSIMNHHHLSDTRWMYPSSTPEGAPMSADVCRTADGKDELSHQDKRQQSTSLVSEDGGNFLPKGLEPIHTLGRRDTRGEHMGQASWKKQKMEIVPRDVGPVCLEGEGQEDHWGGVHGQPQQQQPNVDTPATPHSLSRLKIPPSPHVPPTPCVSRSAADVLVSDASYLSAAAAAAREQNWESSSDLLATLGVLPSPCVSFHAGIFGVSLTPRAPCSSSAFTPNSQRGAAKEIAGTVAEARMETGVSTNRQMPAAVVEVDESESPAMGLTREGVKGKELPSSESLVGFILSPRKKPKVKGFMDEEGFSAPEADLFSDVQATRLSCFATPAGFDTWRRAQSREEEVDQGGGGGGDAGGGEEGNEEVEIGAKEATRETRISLQF